MLVLNLVGIRVKKMVEKLGRRNKMMMDEQ